MTRMACSLFLILSLGGCLHTRAVGEGTAANQHEKGKLVAAPRPVGTRPESVLKTGAARRLQRALREQGYAASDSGEIDETTRNAIARFQRQHNLAPTGFPDLDTVGGLGLDPNEMYVSGSTKKEDDAEKRQQHREAARGRRRE